MLRRKWIILPFLVLMPAMAYVYAGGGTPAYEASAQVLLNRQSQSLSGLEDPLIWQPERLIRTQTDIARLPVIAQRVVRSARLDEDANTFLDHSAVDSNDQVDLLTFRVRDEGWSVATLLANLYARKYIAYRQELDTTALREALQSVKKQIRSLEKRGLSVGSPLYGTLAERQQQLESAGTLQKSNALLVRQANASSVVQVAPRPMRTALLALALGAVLALGLAFLVETLDTRIREPEQLADELGLTLLGSLADPPPGRPSLVMVEEPNSPAAELFRIVRTGLEVTAFSGGCRSLIVTSAIEAEGKSTTAANLAVALARTGRHVVLLDMDLRRPSLGQWFDVNKRPGITDIVFGRASVESSAVRLTFGDLGRASVGSLRRIDQSVTEHGNGTRAYGILEVIGPGTPPQNPGDFVDSSQLDATLELLKDRADLIVVDGPPLLLAGDALTLSSKVDALLLVTRMNLLQRGQISELARVLAASPAMKLGLVATGHSVRRRSYYGVPGAQHTYSAGGRQVGYPSELELHGPGRKETAGESTSPGQQDAGSITGARRR